MGQKLTLQFDDDELESQSPEVVIEGQSKDGTVGAEMTPDAVNESVTVTSPTPVYSRPRDNQASDSVEVNRTLAYRVGVLTIGLPIIALLFIFGMLNASGSSAENTTDSSDQGQANTETKQASSDKPTDKVLGESAKSTDSQNTSQDAFSEYIVEPGDTLYGIGLKLEVDHIAIAEVNEIEPPYSVHPGQTLKIPPSAQ